MFGPKELRMTRQQARSIRKFIPTGYMAQVEARLREQGLPVPSQPFISNVKNGRREHAAIERILLDLVREERERQEALHQEIASLTA